jgi:hypothetical protein
LVAKQPRRRHVTKHLWCVKITNPWTSDMITGQSEKNIVTKDWSRCCTAKFRTSNTLDITPTEDGI